MSLQKELNRLAGTSCEAQKAANVLAGTTGRELVYALNIIAGTLGRELNGVLKKISTDNGGSSDLDSAGALVGLSTGSVIVGGFNSLVIAFSSAFTDGPAFYDARGVLY